MAMNKRNMFTMKRSCSCSMPGVWSAVGHNEGAAVIFHSPKACGHVTRDMELGSYYHGQARRIRRYDQHTSPLVTSNLREEHSIFGGTEQLSSCIDYVVETYAPQYILIANSCVSGVIGDDIQAVAAEKERQCQLPILEVACSGFLDGEYYAGYYCAAIALMERFMEKKPVRPRTVTLLGDRTSSFLAAAQEIRHIFDAFGLTVHCHFPGPASLSEIREVPASSLCIPLSGRNQSSFSMIDLAQAIENRFAIPYLQKKYPSGWRSLQSWIDELAEMTGKQAEGKMVIRNLETILNQKIRQPQATLKNKKLLLAIGRPLIHFQPHWVMEFIALSGAQLLGILLFDGLTEPQKNEMRHELRKYTSLPIWEENDGEETLLQADILITTHEIETDKNQLFLPVLPPVGISGISRLLQQLMRLANQSRLRGGMIYGW